jgi:hypothetical protein
MHGRPADFEQTQWRGAENVARAAKEVGAKLVHVSAIGADANSAIPYARTKALGEQAVFEQCPNATIIRPSLVFGPGDEFFAVSSFCFNCFSSWLTLFPAVCDSHKVPPIPPCVWRRHIPFPACLRRRHWTGRRDRFSKGSGSAGCRCRQDLRSRRS